MSTLKKKEFIIKAKQSKDSWIVAARSGDEGLLIGWFVDTEWQRLHWSAAHAVARPWLGLAWRVWVERERERESTVGKEGQVSLTVK